MRSVRNPNTTIWLGGVASFWTNTNLTPMLKKVSAMNWNGRAPITFTLTAVIGLLVFATSGVVSGVAVWLAQKNTFALLSDNANQAVVSDVAQLELHLKPAEFQTQFIADQLNTEKFNSNVAELGTILTGALAAAPQIDTILFIDKNSQSISAKRDQPSIPKNFDIVEANRLSDLRNALPIVANGPIWLPPVWSEEFNRTFLPRAHPVFQNNELYGAVFALVSINSLSDYVSNNGLSATGNRFILFGKNHVLAHWMIANSYPDHSSTFSLPELSNFADPVLASIWQVDGYETLPLDLSENTEAHALNIFNEQYTFLYQTLDGYGEQSLIVGAYFQPSDIPEEIKRFLTALIVGLAALIVSLFAAIFIGKRIAQPIVRFSKAAVDIQQLDVSKVEELPGSLFRELNDQSTAFNSMLRALRWFEMYVPKKIVEQLIRHGDVQDSSTNEREITVMFTDIAGFSTVSEGMSAPEVAEFVNHHFSLLVTCIEAEDGIVDKFMGDAVMAFWDTPDSVESTSDKACRAALSISVAIDKDNRQRELIGKPPVGVRVGIHTGMATVGNIGAPGRLNYTIIGDTVNIGQRLEQLGKQVYPAGNEISILLSGNTADQLGSDFNPVSVGSQNIKGRIGQIDVYKLV